MPDTYNPFRPTTTRRLSGNQDVAVGSNPSDSSGDAAPVRPAPAWKSFVDNTGFQESNRAGIAAEQNQIESTNRQIGREQAAAEEARASRPIKMPKWKVGAGTLSRTLPDGTTEELDAEEYADHPELGAVAGQALFKRDLQSAKDEVSRRELALQDPTDKRKLTPKQREDILAAGALLQESDPEHVRLKQQLKDDDARTADESAAFEARKRLQEFSQGGVPAYMQRRAAQQYREAIAPQNVLKRAQDAQQHDSANASAADAAERSWQQERDELRQMETDGISGSQLESYQQRKKALEDGRFQLDAAKSSLPSDSGNVAQVAKESSAVQDQKSAGAGPRKSYGDALASALQGAGLYGSATSAMGTASDRGIRRAQDGNWDLPLMKPTLKSDGGALAKAGTAVVDTIGNLGVTAGQKLGFRMDSGGYQKQQVQDVFHKFQQDNNLSDEEVSAAWNDLSAASRKWDDGEGTRVLSDGRILLNPSSSQILDTKQAEKLIDESAASPEDKEVAKSGITQAQTDLAANKLQSYEAAANVLNNPAGKALTIVGNPLAGVSGGGLLSPTEWAAKTGRKDIGSPDFILAYERNVIDQQNPVAKMARGIATDWILGNAQNANTVLGLGGLAGSEKAAKLAGEGAEASDVIGRGKADTGLVGQVVQQVPQLAAQVVTGRLLGGLAGIAGKAAPTITNLGTVGMAGAQSAGQTYAQQRADGASHEEAYDNAIKSGMSTAIVTGIFQGMGAGGIEKVAAGKEVGEITVGDLLKSASKKELLAQTKRFVGHLAKEAGGELAEEQIDQLAQSFLTAKPDTNLSTAWEESVQAGLVGGITGGAAHVVAGYESARPDISKINSAWQTTTSELPPVERIQTESVAQNPDALIPTKDEIVGAAELSPYGFSDRAKEITKQIDQRQEDYIAARQEGRIDAADAIAGEIEQLAVQREGIAADDHLAAVTAFRQLNEADAANEEAVQAAAANLEQAQASGDANTVAIAQQGLDKAGQQSASVPRAKGAMKLASGQDFESLTTSELNALGIQRNGKPLSDKSLEKVGLTAPLVELGADGSPIILDEAVKQIRQISPEAADHIRMGETEARRRAVQRAKAAKAPKSSTPAAEAPRGTDVEQGSPSNIAESETQTHLSSSDETQAMPSGDRQWTVTGTQGSVVKVTAPTIEKAREAAVTADEWQIGEFVQKVDEGASVEASPAAQSEPAAKPETAAKPPETPEQSSDIDEFEAKDDEYAPDEAVKKSIRREVAKAKQSAKGLFKISNDPFHFAHADENGTITLNPDELAKEAEAQNLTGKQAAKWVRGVIDEEIRHVAQYKAAEQQWKKSGSDKTLAEWRSDYYGKLWQDEFVAKGKDRIVSDLYGKGLDGQPDWQKAMEALRMMSQQGSSGEVTERAKLWVDLGKKAIEHLKAALEALKKLVANPSPAIKAEIEYLEKALAEVLGSIQPGTKVTFDRKGEALSGQVERVTSDGKNALVVLDKPAASGLKRVMVPVGDLTEGERSVTPKSESQTPPLDEGFKPKEEMPLEEAPAGLDKAQEKSPVDTNSPEYKAIQEAYDSSMRLAQSHEDRGDKAGADKLRKAAGFKRSAAMRKLTGELTGKERAVAEKKEASLYTGKRVLVDGKPGAIERVAFGKVLVSFDDGAKAVVEKENVEPEGDVSSKAARLSDESRSNTERLIAEAKKRLAAPELREEVRKQQEAFPEGQVIGRPDLANRNVDPEMRKLQDQVDEIRKYQEERETREQWDAEGRKLADEDPEGVKEVFAEAAFGKSGVRPTPAQVRAFITVMEREAQKAGNDPEKHLEMAVLMHANREAMADIARTLASAYDPLKTPAQRHREVIAKSIYEIPQKQLRKIEGQSLSPSARKSAIEGAARERIEKVAKELQKLGLSLDEVLSGKVQPNQIQQTILKDTAANLEYKKRLAIQMIREQNTVAQIRRRTGLTDEQIQKVNTDYREALKAEMKRRMAAGESLEDIKRGFSASKAAKLSEKQGENSDKLMASGLAPDDIDAELDRMLEEQMGIPKEVPTKRKRLPVAPKTKENILKANWTRPEIADGLARYDFDSKDRSAIMQDYDALRNVLGMQGRIDRIEEPKARKKALDLIQGLDEKLKPYGISTKTLGSDLKGPESYRFDINDRAHVMTVARAISAMDADIFDKVSEYYYNSILSGLQTSLVNLSSVPYSAWNGVVERGLEMAIGKALKDPNAPQWGESKYVWSAMRPALARALSNAAATWGAETNFFDEDMLGHAPDVSRIIEGRGAGGPAIGGKAGRFIRIPSRSLMFADEFVRTANAMMEVGAIAFRLAKAEGLKPGSPEFEKFMKGQVNVPGSVAWQMAAGVASNRVFTQALPGQTDPVTGKKVPISTLGNLLSSVPGSLATFMAPKEGDNTMKKVAKMVFRLSFLPFLKVPTNILRQGLDRVLNPVSLADIGILFARNLRVKDGNWTMNADGGKGALVEKISHQLQGAALVALLAGLGAGEGDDDDLDKPILITGSRPWSFAKAGLIESQDRSGMGPYEISVKLPGGRRWTSKYGRFEPAATVLGATIDTMNQFKRFGKGRQTAGQAAGNTASNTIDQVQSKSFLKGIADLLKLGDALVSENEDYKARVYGKFAADRIGAILPNLIKQPVRELDDTVHERPDSFYQQVLASAWPYGQGAEKFDPYGATIEKQGIPAARTIDPTDSGTMQPNKYDEMLSRYAQNFNPNDRRYLDAKGKEVKPWGPDDPDFNYLKDGKKVRMNGAQASRFRQISGKLIQSKLAVAGLNLKNPTARDIEKFKDVVSDVRGAVKKQLVKSSSFQNLK